MERKLSAVRLLSLSHIAGAIALAFLSLKIADPVFANLSQISLMAQFTLLLGTVLFPALYFILGIGIWRMQKWAWWTSFIVHGFSFILSLVQVSQINRFYVIASTHGYPSNIIEIVQLGIMMVAVKFVLGTGAVTYLVGKRKAFQLTITLSALRKPLIATALILITLSLAYLNTSIALAEVPPATPLNLNTIDPQTALEKPGLTTYTYEIKHDGINIEKLADDIKTKLGKDLRGTDGGIFRLDRKIIIETSALDAQQKSVLDQIVANHYDPEAEQLLNTLKAEKARAESMQGNDYIYTRGKIGDVDAIRRLVQKITDRLGETPAINVKDDKLIITFGKSLNANQKGKLDRTVGEEEGTFVGEAQGSILNPQPGKGAIIVYNTAMWSTTYSYYWFRMMRVQFTQSDPLVEYVILWEAETYNTGGTNNYWLQMDYYSTPLAIYYYGRDPYATFWIRTMHGARDWVYGPSYHVVDAYYMIMGGTGNIFFKVLIVQPIAIISLLDIVSFIFGLIV